MESERQIVEIAKSVKDPAPSSSGAAPSSPVPAPYAFQGLKAEGLELLREARKVTGLPIVTEIMRVSHIPCSRMWISSRSAHGTCRISSC